MNYYNENDPKAAAWLRELIAAKLIPAGHVDERSILDVKPHELTKYCQQHFFAGIGGWALALQLAGWPESVPVRTGSCPCQPFSSAGKQKGEADARHLWPHFRDLITFGEPTVTFGEQVASPLGREWLAGVRLDLEGLGYEVGAADLCAAGVGSPHIRQRLYWVAHCESNRRKQTGWNESRASGGWQIGGFTSSSSVDGRLANAPNSGLEGCGADGRLADSDCSQRDGFTNGQRRKLYREASRRKQSDGEFESSGINGGLADAESGNGRGKFETRGARSGRRGLTGNGEADGLVQSDGAGRDAGQFASKTSRHGNTAEPAGGANERVSRCDYQWPPGTPNMVVRCEDGKQRRFGVEPGALALAHGFSDDVAAGWLQSNGWLFPLAEGVKNRIGLLRGFGNAIVPQVAAEFIAAYLEAK